MNCVACNGSGRSSKGAPCWPCRGTGQTDMRADLVPFAALVDRDTMAQRAAYAHAVLVQLPCVTEEDFARIGEALRQVKRQIKELDAKRKRVTKPLDDVKKEIMGWFKPVIAVYEQAETVLKGKLLDYQKEQEQKRLALLPKIQDAHQTQDYATAVQLASAMHASQAGEAQGVSFRETWDFEVINVGLLPPDYLTPNMTAIRQTMHAQTKAGKDPVIPGVRFFKRTGVAVR